MRETASSFVERVLNKWLPQILQGEAVAVPDDDEEMNWRLFFAHSQDMAGFAADIFTGGRNERSAAGWRGLRDRWRSTSHALLSDLALLWAQNEDEFKKLSYPFKPPQLTNLGIGPLVDLMLNSGIPGAELFGRAVQEFKGHWAARKTNKMLRAYVGNAAFLKPHGFSYRAYLRSIVPSAVPPRGDVLQAEAKWVEAVDKDFYNPGDPLANYMICDWLLWFWMRGEIDWFASFKADSVQKRSPAAMLDLPQTDRAFVESCRAIRVPDGFGELSQKPFPPRVLNECIWLEGNRSTQPKCRI